MQLQELTGYGAAIVAGLVIGLAGGGGSILTVPIFVYLFRIEPVMATTYSLFVVGTTSLVGSVSHILRREVDFRSTATFAVPSFVSVFIARWFLVPAIPDPLLELDGFVLAKQDAILYFFAFVMLFAARGMIRSSEPKADKSAPAEPPRYGLLALDGLAVGLLTGTSGAGGGFLIVPMLVLLAKLPMHRAVATSMLIIAVNSFVGFLGDLHRNDLNWRFLLEFTLFSTGGILIGIYLAQFVAPMPLKRGFGWFVLVVAGYIIVQEILTSRSML
ncbi:sulfite exporter TauE/SafE family protein [Larkinella soli]|uniref:sulfite exporter TauE/SafE family protein n=1 Tax=Larkinella soli TaxID=1770527 RepID=UPI000FFBD531|nr:sulfite exporter TauE/SafE family protein [Larkinella soli]